MKFILSSLISLALVGCGSVNTMSDGKPGIQLLPDLDCKGKITLTATGSLSGNSAIGGNLSNMGTLQADCGEGFYLKHDTPATGQ